MSEPSRRTLTLALAITPGIGGKTITRILTRNDLLGRSIKEFLKLGTEALREEYRMKAGAAQKWSSDFKELIREAEAVQARLDPKGVSLVTAADAHYPRLIEALDPDPPGVLYMYGNMKLLEARTFCVLSSRGSTEEAHGVIDRRVEEAVLDGQVLVTGHDTPEYQRAAVVPLRWGAPRILVLDTGLFKTLGEDLKEEPFRTARLWRYQFDPRTDLVVSAVNPDRDYHPNSNRIRDRLVAGLALTLEFVSIAQGGNMQRLAIQGLRAGRTVRVSELSAGAEDLKRQGAQIIPCG
jgi:DNA processing protein